MIQPGELAPDFTLESTQGRFTLSAFRGHQRALLIFYPRDNTPGCTRQLCAARDAGLSYAARGVRVVAVNPGSLASHRRWAENNGFEFPICADEGKAVAAAYGVLGPLGQIQRTVFLVDRQGVVRWVQPGNPSTTEILAAVSALDGQD